MGDGEYFFGIAGFDDLAVLHDVNAVGHVPHDAEVVRDEQHRHAHFFLQRLEQLQDLRLDRDVERGCRLVGDQQVWLVGERDGDHHALPLAAGKLMRISSEPLFGVANADLGQQFDHARARCLVGNLLMQLDDFADLLLDGVQRIERRHRLLKDDRNSSAADGAQLRFVGFQNVLAFEQDFAGRVRCGVGQQPQDRHRRYGFSRTRFADEGDGLPIADRERHVR